MTDRAQRTVHENIVVNSKGRAVYWLSGDSKSHPKCTKANGCLRFWPPVKVASRSNGQAAKGFGGTWSVVKASGSGGTTTTTTATTTTTTATTTTPAGPPVRG